MEKRQAAFDERLDELYRKSPEHFVAARNELVKELRAEGDRDGAEQLKKLRRPTATASLINLVALESQELLEEFAAASEAIEGAQKRALEGDEAATAEWRKAADRERQSIAAVRDAAERAAREAGRPASPRALELVVETLRAAGNDPELRDRVLRGRVEREQAAATLGIPAFALSRRPKARSARHRDDSKPRRERERLERELAEATSREARLRIQVEETAEALRNVKAKLADSRRETAKLRRELKAAEQRARG